MTADRRSTMWGGLSVRAELSARIVGTVTKVRAGPGVPRRPRACPTKVEWLIRVQVFGRHIVLGDLSRVNFSHVRVGCVLNTFDRLGLEGLPFFHEFFNALRACLRDIRQSLGVAGLAG